MFTSSNGTKVRLLPVSRFLIDGIHGRQYRERLSLKPPEVEIETVGGKELVLVTDSMVASLSDDKRKEYEAYVSAKNEMEKRHNEELTELLFVEGTDIDVPSFDSAWAKRMKHYGIDVSEDDIPRKMQYILNTVLVTEIDVVELFTSILENSGTKREVVENIRQSFRDAMEETGH